MRSAAHGVELITTLPGLFGPEASVEHHDRAVNRVLVGVGPAVTIRVANDFPVDRSQRQQSERHPFRIPARQLDLHFGDRRWIEIDRKRRRVYAYRANA